jgi:hypothetical protein
MGDVGQFAIISRNVKPDGGIIERPPPPPAYRISSV